MYISMYGLLLSSTFQCGWEVNTHHYLTSATQRGTLQSEWGITVIPSGTSQSGWNATEWNITVTHNGTSQSHTMKYHSQGGRPQSEWNTIDTVEHHRVEHDIQ